MLYKMMDAIHIGPPPPPRQKGIEFIYEVVNINIFVHMKITK